MRIASNLKKSVEPIIVPCVGTSFYESGRTFQITNVSLSMNRRDEHIMKVEASCDDCYINLEMVSLHPFATQ